MKRDTASWLAVSLFILGSCARSPGFLLGGSTCGGPTAVTHATIPAGMSLLDFDSMIVNRSLGELYYAMHRPPAYSADTNYISTILSSPDPGRYLIRDQGHSQAAVPECVRWNSTLDVLPGANTAVFIWNKDIPRREALQVMWSSCPASYVWSMRCSAGLNVHRCALKDVYLGLFLHQTSLDDLLLNDIMQDLCATGIKFGASDFKWAYSFGPNTLC